MMRHCIFLFFPDWQEDLNFSCEPVFSTFVNENQFYNRRASKTQRILDVIQWNSNEEDYIKNNFSFAVISLQSKK